jgi:hypothetical protein
MLCCVHVLQKLNVIAHIALRQSAQVILRGHDFTVGTGRADGEQVATLGTVQVGLFGKDVC